MTLIYAHDRSLREYPWQMITIETIGDKWLIASVGIFNRWSPFHVTVLIWVYSPSKALSPFVFGAFENVDCKNFSFDIHF